VPSSPAHSPFVDVSHCHSLNLIVEGEGLMGEAGKAASCLYGGIRYEIIGSIHHVRFCHCTNRRKFSGTSHSAWGLIETTQLLIERSETAVSLYKAGNGFRAFCGNCGSPLWYEPTMSPQYRGIPLGIIHSDAGVPAPEMHVWTRSKVAWEPILDNLPPHEAHP
jgi:hypothetical protein